jgi:hypothetical protein
MTIIIFPKAFGALVIAPFFLGTTEPFFNLAACVYPCANAQLAAKDELALRLP